MTTNTFFTKRNLLSLVGFAAIAVLTGCQNTESASSGDYANSADDDDGVVCKMEKRVGSNMMTRVCRTAEQRAAQAEAGREGMLRLQRAGSTSNADG